MGPSIPIQQTYKAGKPRDCRIQRTSPNEESYKEFTKCLTLILKAAKLYPVKTLQRELLTFVAKQLKFFIFPPNRVRHKKQNHLIKRAKKFQEGKWEDLWKQSLNEFEIEMRHIQPPKEKSTAHKVRQAENAYHCIGLHRVADDLSALTFQEWDPSTGTDDASAPVAMVVNSSELRAADFHLAEVSPLQLDAVARGDRRTHGVAVRKLQDVGNSTFILSVENDNDFRSRRE